MGKMGREQRRIVNRNCPILVWRANRQGEKKKVNMQMDNTLALIRKKRGGNRRTQNMGVGSAI
ncbi:MAG: hypothetical protein K2N00_00175, partial [Lachnospiraceae bacterium]|nr:hypothetical protein [Lachnospiraceae bacterium]